MQKSSIQLASYLFIVPLVFLSFSIQMAQGQSQTGQGQGQTGQGQSQTGQGQSQTGQSPSQVQTLNLDTIDPLHGASIDELLEKIVRWLRNIAAPIAAGMIVYGAYQMLFAAGDPEKFKVGRQTILYTVIGYAIIWIGWGITSIIKEFLATP